MSKTAKRKTVTKTNVPFSEDDIAIYNKVKNFKTELGKFVKQKDLNFYYDVDDELLEIMVKTELLDYDIEDELLTDLEKRTKYTPNTRIALFFGFLEQNEALCVKDNERGYLFSEEDWEDIVRGFLFEEDFFEILVKKDVLNKLLEKKPKCIKEY